MAPLALGRRGNAQPTPFHAPHLSMPFSSFPTFARICSKSAMAAGRTGDGGRGGGSAGTEAEGAGVEGTSGRVAASFRFRRGMTDQEGRYSAPQTIEMHARERSPGGRRAHMRGRQKWEEGAALAYVLEFHYWPRPQQRPRPLELEIPSPHLSPVAVLPRGLETWGLLCSK